MIYKLDHDDLIIKNENGEELFFTTKGNRWFMWEHNHDGKIIYYETYTGIKDNRQL